MVGRSTSFGIWFYALGLLRGHDMNETVHGGGIWAVRLWISWVRNPPPPFRWEGYGVRGTSMSVDYSYLLARSLFCLVYYENVYGFIFLPTEALLRLGVDFECLPRSFADHVDTTVAQKPN